MKKFGPLERENAVASLFRVRAAESAPDQEGLKQVWHQGAKGADLLSYVNMKGQVVRQEFTLFEDHFIWTPLKGLVTGQVRADRGSLANAASEEIRFDATLSPVRIRTGAGALSRYDGADKYILHIRTVLSLAEEGTEEYGVKTVTHIHGPPLHGTLPNAPGPRGELRHYLIGGALLGAGVVALVVVWLWR